MIPIKYDPNRTIKQNLEYFMNCLNDQRREMRDGKVEKIKTDVSDVKAKQDDQGLVDSIVFVTLAESDQIDEVTASEHVELFKEWTFPVHYAAGKYAQHDGMLYRCLQAHDSQEGWSPDQTPALWKVAADPGEEWPEWSQPISAADAYDLGAKVSHNGKHWISTAEANVWEPGVYGWEEA